MKLKNLVFTYCLFIGVLFLSSCGSSKDIVYFQKADAKYDSLKDFSKYEAKINKNDNLYITVSSVNPQATEIFNATSIQGSYSIQTMQLQGYLVDESGNINFPLIGSVPLAGKTKREAIDLLQEKISEYIEKPIVNIRFMNYKVTVLGEVNTPGMFVIEDEKITLVQAISRAGDLTIYGNRHNVMICREVDGKKEFYREDLTSPNVFSSPVYYLQQNDVVYIEPNKTKAGSSTYNQNLPLVVSLISVLITAVALFTR